MNYYVIGGIGLIFTLYITFVLAYASKRKKKQLEKFKNLKALNRNEKNALVFGAILSLHRGENVLEMKPQGSIDLYIKGLKDSWDIASKEEAVERISTLISLDRSKELDSYLPVSSSDLIKIQKEIAKGLKLKIEIVELTDSTFSWDICRSISLAKWCFWCGYLSEEESWQFINQGVKVAQNLGSTWENYTISFLLGRTMQGFSLEDVIIESEQLLSGKNLLGKQEFLTVYTKFPFK